MKNVVLASTSTLRGESYLEYLFPVIEPLFQKSKEVIFIPYARPGGITHDEYTLKVKEVFDQLRLKVKGIHEFKKPVEAMKDAEAIFIGGGNTFLLLDKLYRNNLINQIKENVSIGIPYLGISAGTNVAGLSIQTTNDMPIIYPPAFQSLGLVPFNINPHYLDTVPSSTHGGETRETRIKEFHTINTQPVIGLREGSWLEYFGDQILLKGRLPARIFKMEKEPYEVESNTNLSDLN
ncbi:dipeptidase PepE [soil metagenome]